MDSSKIPTPILETDCIPDSRVVINENYVKILDQIKDLITLYTQLQQQVLQQQDQINNIVNTIPQIMPANAWAVLEDVRRGGLGGV